MKQTILKGRWENDPVENLKYKRILKYFNEGGNITKAIFPLDNKEERRDLRGINAINVKISRVVLEYCDLSYADFSSSRVERSTFADARFDRVNFSSFSDHANIFSECAFTNCNFNSSALGYDGSRYVECIFEDCNFLKAIFIRAEFEKCEFRNCKMKGIDFNASSFEDCVFAGKIEDVWFRGGYPIPSDENQFGVAKKNKMRDVSFEGAILTDVTFSDHCDLSTIRLPVKGNYYLLSDWKKRLDNAKMVTVGWSGHEQKEANVFLNSYLVHAQKQDWYLLNQDDITVEFGEDLTDKLLKALGAFK